MSIHKSSRDPRPSPRRTQKVGDRAERAGTKKHTCALGSSVQNNNSRGIIRTKSGFNMLPKPSVFCPMLNKFNVLTTMRGMEGDVDLNQTKDCKRKKRKAVKANGGEQEKKKEVRQATDAAASG